MFSEKYNYASGLIQDRYITLGEYGGLGRDIPDIIFLAFTIYITAITFLSEESSNMTVLIKSSPNSGKMLLGKILSLFGMLLSVGIFRMLAELFTIASRGSFAELKYPIQSIQFFQGCPYKLTIAQGLLASEALRFLGILFVSALIILFTVTTRKPIIAVFVPSAICLLQQFVFDPATGAYYLPTGLLRAVGYFRGNAFETLYAGSGEEKTVQSFSEIPFVILAAVIIFVILFILFAVLTAAKYYSEGKSAR
ncbi:MAG: hypothetical protein NC299_14850 [Lachnospiraceae bacterium]|nr:hypothetical protein [Ruminococcus sp.]MCM1276615.1 hypothetical protein [Lachnospiraceae bacterium]